MAPDALDAEDAPLLPRVLLRASVLLWLWVLPLAVLLALNVQGYLLIEGNMDEAQLQRAHIFGWAGLANLLLGLVLYAAGRSMAKRCAVADGALPVWWGVTAILVQVSYLWLALAWSEQVMIPVSVREWIYPPQRFLYNQFAFAMVPLFWGLMRLAGARVGPGWGRGLTWSIAMAVAGPVGLFLFFQLLASSGRGADFGPYVVVIFVILFAVLMFVGVIRGIALWLRGVDVWSGRGERNTIAIFALALPLGGLLLNHSIAFPNNFQAWEVYLLTVVNAAFLLVASWLHVRRPLMSLGLLCVTLPFSLYFFVVFMPFLPLSIFAVLALGTGFLVMTPTVLLILHLSLLGKARRGSNGRRLITGALCFMVLPGFFTVRALADKAALNAALDYVYAPTIREGPMRYEASRLNLRRALTNHRSYKDGIYYPLLSDYYAWLVFDNLVLPDEKLARLEEAFFGKTGEGKTKSTQRGEIWGGGRGSSNRDRNRMPRVNTAPRSVEVAAIDFVTRDAGGATLKLTLRNTGNSPAEYAKKIPLPAGVYVSGFRLHINGVAVAGRITEKKTALWVYTMIRDSERRDPGLLFYNAPDELELRVFPVAPEVLSVVEIDFLAPEGELFPADWAVPGNERWLPEMVSPRLVRLENAAVFALGAVALPEVGLPAYLHVIVDRSADNGFDGDLAAALVKVAEKFPGTQVRRVTLANYETVEQEATAVRLGALPLRGGLLVDLALAQAIRRHGEVELDTPRSDELPARPVFVILGKKAIPMPSTFDWTDAWVDLLPTLEVHGVDAEGAATVLRAAEKVDAPLLRLGESVRPLKTGRTVRFKANGKSEDPLEFWSPGELAWKRVESVVEQTAEAAWMRAVALQLAQKDYERSPGGSPVDLKALVAASRESGVMLASTSYIVVENAAQWRMLDVGERKKLDQNAALDFKEAPAPSWVWLSAGFGLWIGWRRWRTSRREREKARSAALEAGGAGIAGGAKFLNIR